LRSAESNGDSAIAREALAVRVLERLSDGQAGYRADVPCVDRRKRLGDADSMQAAIATILHDGTLPPGWLERC